MKRRLQWAVVLLSFSLIMSSCQMKRIINDNGFIQTITVDKTDQPDIYRFGIMFPDPEKGSTKNPISLIYESENLPIALSHFQFKTRYSLVVGQLRNVIISRELAEEVGLNKLIQSLLYHPKFPLTTRIMIHDGKASEYLKLSEDLTDYHLANLILKLQDEYRTGTNTLFNFVRNEMEPGIDPILLQSSINEGSAYINGVRLFKKDKSVGRLEEQEVPYILMFRNPKVTVSLNIPKEYLPTDQNFIIENAIVKRHISVQRVNPIPKVDIHFTIFGPLVSPINELTANSNKITEAMIEKAVEQDLNHVLDKLQSLQADSIGIGTFVRNKMSFEEWDEEEWREMFKKADIRCRVRFTLENKL